MRKEEIVVLAQILTAMKEGAEKLEKFEGKRDLEQIKIPTNPEGLGIFNPTTENDGRGRASGYSTQLKEIKK